MVKVNRLRVSGACGRGLSVLPSPGWLARNPGCTVPVQAYSRLFVVLWQTMCLFDSVFPGFSIWRYSPDGWKGIRLVKYHHIGFFAVCRSVGGRNANPRKHGSDRWTGKFTIYQFSW